MQEGRWHLQGWEVLVGEQGAETVRTDLGMRVTAGRASHIWQWVVWKVVTNLDSILKSRDITLSTKVHLVKAMVFPVPWDFFGRNDAKAETPVPCPPHAKS